MYLHDLDPEIHDRYLEICRPREGQIITIIELLSPFNKRPGARAFKRFRRRREIWHREPTGSKLICCVLACGRVRWLSSDYYALLQRGLPHRNSEFGFSICGSSCRPSLCR